MSNPQTSELPSDLYYEKHGIPQVTLHEAMEHLEISLKTRQTRGVICWIADAGVGKSQAIHQVARKYDYKVVDIRTAAFSLLSAGVPERPADGFFNIAVPADFPRKGDKAIIFFDEINQGQQHAINMFFKLLEDRGVFNYLLPEDCLIVCAMNPATALYQVSKLETLAAFNRRLMKFYIEPDYAEWVKFAETEEFHRGDFPDNKGRPCHSGVLGFLNTSRSNFYDTKARDGHKQFACPATWQTVSVSLYNMEDLKIPLESEKVRNRIAASIGPVLADQLWRYVVKNDTRVDPKDVLEGYKEDSPIRKRVQKMIKSPDGGVVDLCTEVAEFLFEKKLDVNVVAPSILSFWSDLPAEIMQSFYTTLGAASHKGTEEARRANTEYMKSLTRALAPFQGWKDLNAKINAIRDEERRALKGDKDAATNPLAKKTP